LSGKIQDKPKNLTKNTKESRPNFDIFRYDNDKWAK